MKILKMDIKKYIDPLFVHRQESMGIAMMMVLIYHFNQILFYPGFLGVDIFLFLSGYGLCRSLENNNLYSFYCRRIKRIIPTYINMGFLASLTMVFLYNMHYNLWDIVCNITTLNYYGLGGTVYEWYLSFLFILYLCFPLFYRFSSLCVWGLLFSLLISIILLTLNLPWYYDTAFGRIPIIILGIMCYNNINNFNKGITQFFVAFLLVCLLYMFKKINTYSILYMLSPICILIISWLVDTLDKYSTLKKIFSTIGRYSLEIYAANVLLSIFIKSPVNNLISNSSILSFFLYIVLNIILAYIFIINSMFIKTILKK